MAETEDYFENFFRRNPLPMWIYNLETLKFMAVNKAAIQIYGYSEEEFLSMSIRDIRPEEDISRLLENIERVSDGLDLAGDWRHVKKDGSIIHVEITSHVINFQGQKAELVSAKDITRALLAEKELKDNIELLHSSLRGTILTVASIVESRASHTAHHQRRTAELVRAIALAMKLLERQVEGAEMAALVHDLGEIGVPADILNRSGKLTANEYSLVKIHPQIGYDVLKGVKFPWPIAEIILQHHERLDGSGYPFGLRGEDILIEAKIVGLAEVVEAMTSHRPYRQALSIQETFAEISRGRGILFDSQVVDVCVSLFQEDGFEFSQ